MLVLTKGIPPFLVIIASVGDSSVQTSSSWLIQPAVALSPFIIMFSLNDTGMPNSNPEPSDASISFI